MLIGIRVSSAIGVASIGSSRDLAAKARVVEDSPNRETRVGGEGGDRKCEEDVGCGESALVGRRAVRGKLIFSIRWLLVRGGRF